MPYRYALSESPRARVIGRNMPICVAAHASRHAAMPRLTASQSCALLGLQSGPNARDRQPTCAGLSCKRVLALTLAACAAAAAPAHAEIRVRNAKFDSAVEERVLSYMAGKPGSQSPSPSGSGRALKDTLFSPQSQVPTQLSGLLSSGQDSLGLKRRAMRIAYEVENFISPAVDPDIDRKLSYIKDELLPALGSLLARSIRARTTAGCIIAVAALRVPGPVYRTTASYLPAYVAALLQRLPLHSDEHTNWRVLAHPCGHVWSELTGVHMQVRNPSGTFDVSSYDDLLLRGEQLPSYAAPGAYTVMPTPAKAHHVMSLRWPQRVRKQSCRMCLWPSS